MTRQHPLFSPIGCGGTLLFLAILVASAIMSGGSLFSPGKVSASASLGELRGGFSSHADFEDQCEQCHAPWLGASDVRCRNCHTEIDDQIVLETGMHSPMPADLTCETCHTEHLGRDYSGLDDAIARFNHDWTGFLLVSHPTGYDSLPLECASCHSAGYGFDQQTCITCHNDANPVFMAEHTASSGLDCLACHNGSGEETHVTHNFFPLLGGHAALGCTDCHQAPTFAETPTVCVACHAEPEVHAGQFGLECEACHTIVNWREVQLVSHTFPLDHGQPEGTIILCEVCHPTNYVTNTCYSSGCHGQAETETEHLEEGIFDFADCLACHPTGNEDEADD